MDGSLGRLFGGFNRVFRRGSTGYGGGVAGVISRKTLMLVIYLALVGLTFGLFKSVPSGFVPAQDKQYLIGFAQLPDGATLDRTDDGDAPDVATSHWSSRASPTPSASRACRSTASPTVRTQASCSSTPEGLRPAHGPAQSAGGHRRRAEPASSRRSRRPSSRSSRRRRSQGLGHTGGFKLHLLGPRRRSVTPGSPPRTRRSWPRPAGAGTAGAVLELPGQRPAALRRHRPGEGPPARRAGHRGVRHDAGLPRQPLRQRLQPLRADLQRPRPGRRAVPRARRGRRDC